MGRIKHKSDYQIIADAFKVSVWAIKKALQRRDEFPQNKLVKAYDKLQAAKLEIINEMAA